MPVRVIERPLRHSRLLKIGELIDVIVKEVEAANQSNSQGAPDTDVQAEKDQAKDRGVGVIYGLKFN